MPGKHAFSVGIHDKKWLAAGIKKDRIRGFRAYSLDSQQFFTQQFSRPQEHFGKRPVVNLIEIMGEILDAVSFDIKIARGPDKPGQFPFLGGNGPFKGLFVLR